jgi:hypothetical protein
LAEKRQTSLGNPNTFARPFPADRAEAVDVGPLVRRWFLYVIDHEDINRSARRFQLQAELRLHRREDRRLVRSKSAVIAMRSDVRICWEFVHPA